MTEKSIKWLKGLLWLVAIYHILLGLVGIFFKDLAASLAGAFFNFNLTLTPEVYWILNPFAAYVLIFGIFMALAATDPAKYKTVILIGVGLFAIRIIQRIIFLLIAPEGLVKNIDPVRNMLALAIVTVIGLSIFIMDRKLN
ncbi:MAG: hypothetical protein AABX78_02270 [Nanoarchaeota archaeon]